jgi:hypothetical protein
MKPRWLVFALTLPTEDVLFVQYTVPTIIMSRQCDQHSKARARARPPRCLPPAWAGSVRCLHASLPPSLKLAMFRARLNLICHVRFWRERT